MWKVSGCRSEVKDAALRRAGHETVLVTDGLPEISDDQTYELWFVRDGSAIPAGLFASDDGSATALLDGAVESGDVIAVTIEPAGGSPTGQPTSDPILAIQTA